MDGTTHEPEPPAPHAKSGSEDRQEQLAGILARLEHCQRELEALGLTLCVALVDHAIAETKRQASI